MTPFDEAIALIQRAERWLLPGACLLCHEPVEPAERDPLICALCLSRFRRLPEPRCDKCGQPEAGPAMSCRVCAGWPPGLGPVRSAVWLDDRSRLAVHRLKYGGWPRLAEALAQTMIPLLPPGPPAAALVPVPLAPGRARRRGYNQAERLAAGLARFSGFRLRSDLLVRVRDTRTQTSLAPEARQANVAGAFMKVGAPEARLVLVDDVFTTGATLVAAATALLEAGAERVEAITFARAMPPIG